MAEKIHKTLRIENDLVNRVKALQREDEALSNTMVRLMIVGCETLERDTAEDTGGHGGTHAEHGEDTARLLEVLERENARLIAEHEADKRRIDEKDKQIAAALEKAHSLAEQAHVLMGMAQQAEALPEAAPAEQVEQTEPEPIGKESPAAEHENTAPAEQPEKKKGFLSWLFD